MENVRPLATSESSSSIPLLLPTFCQTTVRPQLSEREFASIATICDRGYTLSIRKLMLAVRIASRSTTKLLPLVPSETPEHVLMHCPLHARPRWLWSLECSRERISFNMDTLTGDYFDVDPSKRTLARLLTESLLCAINEKVPW